jgi:hypothetical protein
MNARHLSVDLRRPSDVTTDGPLAAMLGSARDGAPPPAAVGPALTRREEAWIDDAAADGIDAAQVPPAEPAAGPHVHGQPRPAPDEREVQERRDGSVVDAVELLLGLGVDDGEPDAPAVEAEHATQPPAQREQRARRGA